MLFLKKAVDVSCGDKFTVVLYCENKNEKIEGKGANNFKMTKFRNIKEKLRNFRNLEKLRNWETVLAQLLDETVPRVLIKTKQDLNIEIEEMKIKKIQEDLQAKNLYMTSAKDGSGVKQAFEEIAQKIFDQIKIY